MKCSNCGVESPEGANRCRRCGEPLAAAPDPQVMVTEEDEGFIDFSVDEEFTDFSQEPIPSGEAIQPKAAPLPPLPDPSAIQPQTSTEQFVMQPPSAPEFPHYEASPSPPQEKKSKAYDPDAEYLDNYVFPSTPLINEILFGRSGTTNPSIFFTAIIAAILTLVFYKVFPIPTSTGYFHDLFTKRGAWPYVSVYFLWWAICLQINKFFRLMIQKKILKMNLFPPEFDRITSRNVCKLQRHLLQIVPDPLSRIVTNRMWVGLQQYRNLGHIEEVNDLIQYQAEIDLSTTESSFSFLNLLIWAHPIVGFLGTVVGIGTAIGGFSSIVQSAVEIDAIKGALQVVTGGLSTAFDTTLIGLVFAMILMFATVPLKKMEEDFLGDVENFTIRQLLNRMRKKVDEIEEEELDEGARIRKIIQETFQLQLMGLQGAFQTWQGGFSSVIKQIGEETQALGQQFSSVSPIITDFREVMNQFSGRVQDTARQQKGMLEQMGTHVEKLTPVIGSFQQAMEGIDTQRRMISDQLSTWVGNFDKLGEGIGEKFTQIGERVSEGILQSGSGVISEMEKHLTEQNKSLAKMNGKVTKEISKMSSELIGKLENHVSVFEKFQKEQTENISAQSKNLDTLSSSITGEFTKMCETILSKLEGQVDGFQKFSDQYSDYMTNLMGGVSKEITGLTEKILQQFQDQLSGWLSGFIKEQTDSFSKLSGVIGKDIGSVSDGMISKLDCQLSDWIQNLNKELSGNIGNVSASIAKEISGMGESVIKNLELSSQGLIDEIAKVIKEQGSSIEKVLQGFEDVNKSASASSSEIVSKFEALSQLLSSLNDKQGELVGVFNSGIKTIKPELQNLATNISKATQKSI